MTINDLWIELTTLSPDQAKYVMMKLFNLTQDQLQTFLTENKDKQLIIEEKAV